MPEGDSLHRAAQRLQVLVGERVAVETPHPRASGKGLVEALDGRVLEGVEAVGKNLLLRFEGGAVLRSHLRMNGRWFVQPRGAPRFGRPWLVLAGSRFEALQVNGPVLELGRAGEARVGRVGPDILEVPPRLDEMVARLRTADGATWLGEALQRQRLVGGIGNMWMAEALWAVRLSPWRRLADTSDEELRAALEAAHRLMTAGLRGQRPPRRVYRHAGRPCSRCGGTIRSRGQGDENRTAYWCPSCQAGEEIASA